MQTARKHTLLLQTFLNCSLHHFPHLIEVIVNVTLLVHLHILPKSGTVVLAPVEDIGHLVMGINSLLLWPHPAVAYITATYTECGPVVNLYSVGSKRLKQHPVRVLRKKNVPPPVDGAVLLPENILNCNIGKVSLAGRSKAPVQCNLKPRRLRIPLLKNHCRLPRPHSMAAGRPLPYLEYLLYTFHKTVTLKKEYKYKAFLLTSSFFTFC